MTSSNGNIFRVTGRLCGEFTDPGEFPAQRPVTQSFDVFFDLRLNKRLSKTSWGWWFETLSRPLWRYRNVHDMINPQSLGQLFRLIKQSWGWWFETLLRPSWRHCNDEFRGGSTTNVCQNTGISTWIRGGLEIYHKLIRCTNSPINNDVIKIHGSSCPMNTNGNRSGSTNTGIFLHISGHCGITKRNSMRGCDHYCIRLRLKPRTF